MKQLTITLVGMVTHGATRSFVIEVPDEVNPATLDSHVLEDLADQAQIAWKFDTEGFVQMTDHVVEEGPATVQDCPLPVIAFKTPHEQTEAVT
jgi:hypothetical protein